MSQSDENRPVLSEPLGTPARWNFCISGVAFFVLVADILFAKYQVASGTNEPLHLGDLGQFLVLLISVTFFVAGAILVENESPGTLSEDQERSRRDPNSPQEGRNSK